MVNEYLTSRSRASSWRLLIFSGLRFSKPFGPSHTSLFIVPLNAFIYTYTSFITACIVSLNQTFYFATYSGQEHIAYSGRARQAKMTTECITSLSITHTNTKTYLSDVFNVKLDIKGKLNVMFGKHCFLGNGVPAQPAQSTSKTGSFLVSTAKEVCVPLNAVIFKYSYNT